MLSCQKFLHKFRSLSGFLGISVLGCQKVMRKVPPRFHQSFTKIAQGSWSPVFWGRSVHELLNGSAEGSTKVPLKFYQDSPSFVASLVFHQGSTKVLPRLPKFRSLSGFLGQVHVKLPKGSVEGSTKVPPKFYQDCPSFVPKASKRPYLRYVP